MTARILAFPIVHALRPAPAIVRPVLTQAWTEQHLPLIDAAIDLLQADDAEFERRCRAIAEADGPGMLGHLTAQLDRLGSHVGDVVNALAMAAARIRATMGPAEFSADPAPSI